ncbi:uncharacterized protein [Spinacia oleracea]|uniref:Uncharacterized protein n=1 Tax=Spinacia oleracea TaxID=3562 RepID=A0ABM3R0S1_SPIOL|nr:uncharacterized protein LOC110785655 [Spinacia oleracea]
MHIYKCGLILKIWQHLTSSAGSLTQVRARLNEPHKIFSKNNSQFFFISLFSSLVSLKPTLTSGISFPASITFPSLISLLFPSPFLWQEINTSSTHRTPHRRVAVAAPHRHIAVAAPYLSVAVASFHRRVAVVVPPPQNTSSSFRRHNTKASLLLISYRRRRDWADMVSKLCVVRLEWLTNLLLFTKRYSIIRRSDLSPLRR